MLLSSEIIGGRAKRVWSALLPPTCEHTFNAAARRLFAGLRWGCRLVGGPRRLAEHGRVDHGRERLDGRLRGSDASTTLCSYADVAQLVEQLIRNQ